MADIGWRGSIQDNLTRLLPGARLHGCYFLLLEPFVAPDSRSTRQSFLQAEGRTARRLRFGAPLELAVGCSHGSVTGYRMGQDGVRPVEAQQPAIMAEIAARLARFRDAVMDAAVHAPSTAGFALPEILRCLERPSDGFTALYFGCERDERFGAGRILGSPARLTIGSLLAAVARPAARNWLGLELATSGWPWALLRRDLPWLLPLLRPALRHLDLRLPGAPRSIAAAPPPGLVLRPSGQPD